MKLLLEMGADITPVDNSGKTALTSAIESGQTKITLEIIARGS